MNELQFDSIFELTILPRSEFIDDTPHEINKIAFVVKLMRSWYSLCSCCRLVPQLCDLDLSLCHCLIVFAILRSVPLPTSHILPKSEASNQSLRMSLSFKSELS
ncbi:hypothetical protein Tco_0656237 [Tanacetum coccineum]|uniref:Uncharacterized protein n=1 Tax=Tanacetum coccineum TaxID=301880 RepID=A0ABQ4X878_9ASTR